MGSVLFGMHAASGDPPPTATGREQPESVESGLTADPASSSDDRPRDRVRDSPVHCDDVLSAPRQDDGRESTVAGELPADRSADDCKTRDSHSTCPALVVSRATQLSPELGSSCGGDSTAAGINSICGSSHQRFISLGSIGDARRTSAASLINRYDGLTQVSQERGSANGTETVVAQLGYSLDCSGEDASLLLLLREALSTGDPAQQDPALVEMYSALKRA